jgi:gamma-glutamylcyclotransferase (GGCT)/AIG2-like uncharacterized protein YtfP
MSEQRTHLLQVIRQTVRYSEVPIFLPVHAADCSYKDSMASQAAADRGRPSIMVRKFLNTQDGDGYFQSPHKFLPKFYFFYGSLMDPGQLTRVLGLKERPVTHPASIAGYSCKMWGPYPALTDGPPDAIVHGVAFEVKVQQVATRLAEYETDAYEEHDCIIRFDNGETVSGVTFKWCADDLDLREGIFNLREWQSEQ